MNKAELIDAIASRADMPKAAATKALDATLDAIIGEVSKGGQVVLIGFGTFETAARSARTGRNPQTGATLNIPATVLPRFKAGKGFKDAVKDTKSKKK